MDGHLWLISMLKMAANSNLKIEHMSGGNGYKLDHNGHTNGHTNGFKMEHMNGNTNGYKIENGFLNGEIKLENVNRGMCMQPVTSKYLILILLTGCNMNGNNVDTSWYMYYECWHYVLERTRFTIKSGVLNDVS